MWVGMEKPILENLFEINSQQTGGNLAAINPRRGYRQVIRDLDCPYIFQRQYSFGGMCPVHFRNAHSSLALKVNSKDLRVPSFGNVINLLIQYFFEFIQQFQHISPAADWLVVPQPTTDSEERRQVCCDQVFNIWSLYLYNNLVYYCIRLIHQLVLG